MKHSKLFIAFTLAGMVLVACGGNNKEKMGADSSSTSLMTDSNAVTDTLGSDTSVKPADSTHSFRNDRGTDSVSAGKSVPAKP